MPVQRVAAPASGRVVLRITTRSSSVTVVAGGADDVEVDGGSRTSVRTSNPDPETTDIDVTSGSDPISIRCPEGIDVVLSLTSGHAKLQGHFGDVRATTRSGRVTVDDAASLDVRTGSGRITADTCRGECRVMSRSGRVSVGAAGRLRAATKSGRISVGPVDEATVHSASGTIDLVVTGRGRVEIHSMSGSAKVAVTGAACPHVVIRTLSGSVTNSCGEGDDFRLDAKTVSGAVSVVRA